MILAMATKIMKMGVKGTVVGSLTKRCLQDDVVQIALRSTKRGRASSRYSTSSSSDRSSERRNPRQRRRRSPSPPSSLPKSAMMQVHQKLAPLHLPKKEEGIDVYIPLGKGLAVSKSSKKEERTSLSLILMGHMAIRIKYSTLSNNLMQLLVVSTSQKALSFAMLLCISKSLLDIGGLP